MLSKVLSTAVQQSVALSYQCSKFFHMHEYHSKELMRKYGVNVSDGKIATSAEEAQKYASTIDATNRLIVKCQVHAGGRGKGKLTSGLQGGVQVCKTPEEIGKFAKQMIGYNLITKQTTAKGLRVDAVLVETGVKIQRELYLAFVLDRNSQRPACICSKEGGMDIEAVAAKSPDAILAQIIDPKKGLTDEDGMAISKKLEVDPAKAIPQLKALYKLFTELDATQVEINPWAVNDKGEVYCVDAKLNIDDNAQYKQKQLVDMKENSVCSEDIDPFEKEAVKNDLAYVALDGNIGCMVNGAGLAMATMDCCKLFGQEPANFLDVGGAANEKRITTAFTILQNHPKVKAILINIFGGILRCDLLADGVIKAAQNVKLKVPLVVRMAGTNADIGKKKFNDFSKQSADIKIYSADNLEEAAKKACQLV